MVLSWCFHVSSWRSHDAFILRLWPFKAFMALSWACVVHSCCFHGAFGDFHADFWDFHGAFMVLSQGFRGAFMVPPGGFHETSRGLMSSHGAFVVLS